LQSELAIGKYINASDSRESGVKPELYLQL